MPPHAFTSCRRSSIEVGGEGSVGPLEEACLLAVQKRVYGSSSSRCGSSVRERSSSFLPGFNAASGIARGRDGCGATSSKQLSSSVISIGRCVGRSVSSSARTLTPVIAPAATWFSRMWSILEPEPWTHVFSGAWPWRWAHAAGASSHFPESVAAARMHDSSTRVLKSPMTAIGTSPSEAQYCSTRPSNSSMRFSSPHSPYTDMTWSMRAPLPYGTMAWMTLLLSLKFAGRSTFRRGTWDLAMTATPPRSVLLVHSGPHTTPRSRRRSPASSCRMFPWCTATSCSATTSASSEHIPRCALSVVTFAVASVTCFGAAVIISSPFPAPVSCNLDIVSNGFFSTADSLAAMALISFVVFCASVLACFKLSLTSPRDS